MLEFAKGYNAFVHDEGDHMEQYASLISILLDLSQRFFEIWNFQIVVSVAAVGFILSNEGLMARNRIRVNITVLFLLIAVFSVYTLSIHNEREILLWNAIQSRIDRDSVQLTPAETQYLEALRPTSFLRKAVALVFADLMVIAITWVSPKMRRG
jgi:hypothetical protein